MNIINKLSDIIQQLPNYISNFSNLTIPPNPNISSINDLNELINTNDFMFESKIQMCLYKISITNGPINRYHSYWSINEIFLPQYNICMNAVDGSNIFVSNDRHNKSSKNLHSTIDWKPPELINFKIIDIELEPELHQIICNLIESYVEFNMNKLKIGQMIDLMNPNKNDTK